jgi:predicted ATPase/predicted negative regulator of RcsB-dependent stress response
VRGGLHDAILRGPAGFQKAVAIRLLDATDGLVREARLGGLLRHPGLVEVYELGLAELDGQPTWFCALERVSASLASRLPLPPRATVEAAMQVCVGLAHAVQQDMGVGQVSLAHVMLDGSVVKVDLGLARWSGGERADPVRVMARILAELAAYEGTAAVLAPILAQCEGPDRWSDLDAMATGLGALEVDGPGLHEALTQTATETVEDTHKPSLGHLAWGADTFVGRTKEIARLSDWLDTPGLVTVKGPAGVGKTRLARRTGWAYRELTGNAVWFCDISEAASTQGVLGAVATALDLQLGRDPARQVGYALSARPNSLVVLDNFEQVVACSHLIATWMHMAPRTRFVVTSRQPLHLDGEVVLELGVLGLDDALELLTSGRPGRVGTGTDPALVELAVRLDGLPLALELAAARLDLMSPTQLVARLDDRLRLLGRRGAQGRHATLSDALDWSWQLLTDDERAGLAQLSVFSGGFDLEAADEVLDVPCGALDVVERLLDRSLVDQRSGRLRLLQSVRSFAAQQLQDREGIERRHGEHFAREPEPKRVDLDNLVVACRTAMARGDSDIATRTLESVWELLRVTGPFGAAVALARDVVTLVGLTVTQRASVAVVEAHALRLWGHSTEAREQAEHAVALATEAANEGLEARARAVLGATLFDLGEIDPAGVQMHEAHRLAVVSGERRVLANIIGNLGHLRRQQARMDEARSYLEEALSLHRELGNRVSEGVVLCNLAILHQNQGRTREARAFYAAALDANRRIGSRRILGVTLGNLAILDQDQGRDADAASGYRAAIELMREVGDRRFQAINIGNLGNLHRLHGRWEQARTCYEESLLIHREVGNRRSEGVVLGNLAGVLSSEGRVDEARAMYAEALAVHRAVSNRRSEGVVLGNVASTFLAQERWREAEARYREALAVHREIGNRRFEGIVLGRLGLVAGHLGDAAGSEALLDQAADALQRVGDPAELARVYATRAELRLSRGERAGALEMLAAAQALDIPADTEVAKDIAQVASLLAASTDAAT